MKKTKHFTTRCAQRGIPGHIADMVMDFGMPCSGAGGFTEYRLCRQDAAIVIARCKEIIHIAERASRVHVVATDTGVLLTAYHKKN